jgi:hypothetical protein
MYDETSADDRRKYTVAEIAETFGVSRKTIYRHLEPSGGRRQPGKTTPPLRDARHEHPPPPAANTAAAMWRPSIRALRGRRNTGSFSQGSRPNLALDASRCAWNRSRISWAQLRGRGGPVAPAQARERVAVLHSYGPGRAVPTLARPLFEVEDVDHVWRVGEGVWR